MCYEKSVNIFEQNMRERESSLGKNYNARLWKRGCSPDCAAKSAGYQRKCKIFFC